VYIYNSLAVDASLNKIAARRIHSSVLLLIAAPGSRGVKNTGFNLICASGPKRGKPCGVSPQISIINRNGIAFSYISTTIVLPIGRCCI